MIFANESLSLLPNRLFTSVSFKRIIYVLILLRRNPGNKGPWKGLGFDFLFWLIAFKSRVSFPIVPTKSDDKFSQPKLIDFLS